MSYEFLDQITGMGPSTQVQSEDTITWMGKIPGRDMAGYFFMDATASDVAPGDGWINEDIVLGGKFVSVWLSPSISGQVLAWRRRKALTSDDGQIIEYQPERVRVDYNDPRGRWRNQFQMKFRLDGGGIFTYSGSRASKTYPFELNWTGSTQEKFGYGIIHHIAEWARQAGEDNGTKSFPQFCMWHVDITTKRDQRGKPVVVQMRGGSGSTPVFWPVEVTPGAEYWESHVVSQADFTANLAWYNAEGRDWVEQWNNADDMNEGNSSTQSTADSSSDDDLFI